MSGRGCPSRSWRRPGWSEPEAGDPALDISFGIMRALERLSPLERAALFLHDFYDVPFDERQPSTAPLSPAANWLPGPASC